MDKIASLWEQIFLGDKSSIKILITQIDEKLAGLDHVSMLRLSQHMAKYKPVSKLKIPKLPIMPTSYSAGMGWPKVDVSQTGTLWQNYHSNHRTTEKERVPS